MVKLFFALLVCFAVLSQAVVIEDYPYFINGGNNTVWEIFETPFHIHRAGFRSDVNDTLQDTFLVSGNGVPYTPARLLRTGSFIYSDQQFVIDNVFLLNVTHFYARRSPSARIVVTVDYNPAPEYMGPYQPYYDDDDVYDYYPPSYSPDEYDYYDYYDYYNYYYSGPTTTPTRIESQTATRDLNSQRRNTRDIETFQLDIVNELFNSEQGWVIVDTSDGDQEFTTFDRWIILRNLDSGKYANFFIGQTDIPQSGDSPSSANFDNFNLSWEYTLTFAEPGRKSFVFFVEIYETESAAREFVLKFNDPLNCPVELLYSIPDDVQTSFVNFHCGETSTTPPTTEFNVFNVLGGLCKIPTEALDRGAARGQGKKGLFEQPWYC